MVCHDGKPRIRKNIFLHSWRDKKIMITRNTWLGYRKYFSHFPNIRSSGSPYQPFCLTRSGKQKRKTYIGAFSFINRFGFFWSRHAGGLESYFALIFHYGWCFSEILSFCPFCQMLAHWSLVHWRKLFLHDHFGFFIAYSIKRKRKNRTGLPSALPYVGHY